MKNLVKLMTDFTYQNGLEISRVFDDLLRYMIQGYTIPGYPGLKDWHYTKEQTASFYEMYSQIVLIMQEQLKHKQWFDVFGNIYEELIASKSRRSNSGQFFTPESLCDLMADICQGEEKQTGKLISDCACGSGRTLLAHHVRNLGNYYVAEDIDKTCAMMCVCNFLLHGVVGEVVWHNSLIPEQFYGAWKINQDLNNPFSKFWGIPHIQPMEWEDTSIKKMLDGMSKVTRIQKHLQESAEKHLARFKLLRRQKVLTNEEKQEAKAELMKYNNIKRALRKYGKKQQH